MRQNKIQWEQLVGYYYRIPYILFQLVVQYTTKLLRNSLTQTLTYKCIFTVSRQTNKINHKKEIFVLDDIIAGVSHLWATNVPSEGASMPGRSRAFGIGFVEFFSSEVVGTKSEKEQNKLEIKNFFINF